MYKKILVPLDGSETAEAILPFAQEIATHTGAELLLVTAVEKVSVWDAVVTPQIMDKGEAAALQYLGDQAKKLGGSAKSSVVPGEAAQAILSAADREGADLIAMSTHGRSGLKRFLFGSVATKLLEAAKVPVLFLRPKEGEDKGAPGPVVKKILVPMDGSGVASSILPTVEAFAKTMGASIVLFHAVQPIVPYAGFEAGAIPAMNTVTDDLQDHARKILGEACQAAKARGIEASMIVCLDAAVDGILRAGDDARADLIAIGTHGHGGLGRMVLGSVADGVVRRSADIPCLVIRSIEGAK